MGMTDPLQITLERFLARIRAEELRILADYMGQSVQMDHAEALVRSAHEFVQKIAKVFALEAENGDPDRESAIAEGGPAFGLNRALSC
jgi:hypothetical protein